MTEQTPQPKDLNGLVKLSGLEGTTQGKQLLEQFSNYFELAADWEKKAAALVVTSEDQQAEMKMAREGRLFLRRKRIDVENTRKALKERIVREGKAIDGIANVLKALIAPIEEHLQKQEDFVKLKHEREAELAREEAERKAREEQERQEKLDAIAAEREAEALPYRDYWPKMDETLTPFDEFRAMQPLTFQQFMSNCKARRLQALEEQERIRKENERLEAERQERARQDALAAGKLRACEAIFAFASGLTTRKEAITIGAQHGSAIMGELARDFCAAHELGEPAEGWHEKIVPMEGDTWKNSTK